MNNMKKITIEFASHAVHACTKEDARFDVNGADISEVALTYSNRKRHPEQ